MPRYQQKTRELISQVLQDARSETNGDFISRAVDVVSALDYCISKDDVKDDEKTIVENVLKAYKELYDHLQQIQQSSSNVVDDSNSVKFVDSVQNFITKVISLTFLNDAIACECTENIHATSALIGLECIVQTHNNLGSNYELQ